MMKTNYLALILESNSCKEFLGHLFEVKKKKNPNLSLRKISELIGIPHPATLSLIMNAKRQLTVNCARTIASKLDLKGEEKTALELLARIDGAKSDEDRVFFQDILNRFKPLQRFEKVKINSAKDKLTLIDFLVAEVATIKNNILDEPQFLLDRMRWDASIDDIKQSIEKLVKTNILKVLPDGKIERTEKVFCIMENGLDKDYKSIQGEFISLGLESLKQQPKETSDFSSYTVATTKEKVIQAKEKIINFRMDLGEFLESPESETIYQLNVQMFDLLNN